jgi:hypothetical protein
MSPPLFVFESVAEYLDAMASVYEDATHTQRSIMDATITAVLRSTGPLIHRGHRIWADEDPEYKIVPVDLLDLHGGAGAEPATQVPYPVDLVQATLIRLAGDQVVPRDRWHRRQKPSPN